MPDVLDQLTGGDRRSIGRANEVVQQVLGDPSLFQAVVRGMAHHDPIIRMRSADVIEKVTAERPELLQPYKEELIQLATGAEQQEVRWHLAQVLPRLKLDEEEQEQVKIIILDYLNAESKIVKTFAMQALADLAEKDPSLRLQVVELLEELVETGSPAMRSRGTKLLGRFTLRGIDERR